MDKIITTLSYIIGEFSKSKFEIEDAQSILEDLPFNRDHISSTILKAYESSSEGIRDLCMQEAQHEGISGVPQFKQLRWRLDMQLASRHNHQNHTPTYLMRLETSEKSHDYAMSFESLSHITQTLSHAIKEINSIHTRRFQRYID